jgi:hypothetical protein
MGDEGDRTEENIRLLEGLVADVVRGRVAAEWDGHAMELVRVESSRVVVSSRLDSRRLDWPRLDRKHALGVLPPRMNSCADSSCTHPPTHPPPTHPLTHPLTHSPTHRSSGG